MACNWNKEEYFHHLLRLDSASHSALEKLVDDLHTDKDRTISAFLCHSGSEDFLWGLVRLLGEEITRVAGNAAYIIGTLAESELGCYRVLALAHSGRSESETILPHLTRMLAFDDSESVMNAAGTMGTLAESPQGRDWILSATCLDMLFDHVTALLQTGNLWTASNAALVLARLSIAEDGCHKVLNHPSSLNILVKLILSLGTDEAGRGMNAAFAIGRLCDMEIGRQRLLLLPESDKMISSLAQMLSCQDLGASKNACFALSCLATSIEGHERLLKNSHVEEILSLLAYLLKSEDTETGWFAAMTIRTLASQPRGCVKLRDHQPLITSLKLTAAEPGINPDLKEEVEITLDILKRLDKPHLPVVEATDASEVKISWEEVKLKSGLGVIYQVFEGNRSVYKGKECSCLIDGLQPCTKYGFRLRCLTENDESAFTETVYVTTLEGAPGPPSNVRVLGCTITQLKIGWDAPDVCNGVVKGYYIYHGGKQVDFTTDLMAIVTGLSPNTQYTIQVCAATARGKGEKASVMGTTAETGAHAPSKPNVTVLGRNEVHISWAGPEVPFGRITRYDVIMNGKIIHTGTELSCSARRLTPDTEYTFVVVAITSEGKFESKATKKRTSKDEYDVTRQPLYQPPRRDSVTEEISSSSTSSKQIPVKKTKPAPDNKPRVNSAKTDKNTTNNTTKSNSCNSSSSLNPAGGLTSNSTTVSPDSGHRSSTDCSPNNKSPTSKTHDSTNQVTESPKKIKATQKSPTIEKRRDSVASVSGTSKPKVDQHRPSISLHRDAPQSLHRKLTDRYPNIIKNMFPVTVSYVSIQGDKHTDNLDYKIKMSGAWARRPIGRVVVVSNNSSAKLDRTKAAAANLSSVKAKASHTDPDAPIVLDSDVLYEGADVTTEPSEKSSRVVDFNKTFLPKPTMPSQQYLDGGKSILSELSKSCSSTDSVNNRLRSRHNDYLRELTSLQAFQGRSDSLFDSCHNAFLQRASTFVTTHRNSLRKSSDRTVGNKLNNIPGGPIVLNPDLPDNQANKLHKKFVPMQLRTQPSNLPQGQRETQRINVNLLEPRGYPGRRNESLARSHSSLNSHSASNRRGSAKGQSSDDLITLASQEIIKQEKLSQRSSKSQVKSLNSKHVNEPDSVLLSQSWAVNAR